MEKNAEKETTPVKPPEPVHQAKKPLSYPAMAKETPADAELRRKWKEQKRIKCCHDRCWYPLNVLSERGNKRPLETPSGDKAYEAVCTWDPRHRRQDGGPQYVTEADFIRSETGREPNTESLE